MTMWLPADDKMHQLRSEMLDQLVVAMGGRCAEQIVFGDVTSGRHRRYQERHQSGAPHGVRIRHE